MRLESIDPVKLSLKKPSRLRRWISTVLKTMVSLGLLLYLFNKADLRGVAEAFRGIHGVIFVLTASGYLLLQFVNIFRWQVMVRTLGYGQGFRQLTAYYYTGYFFNLFLPTSIGGDLGRCYYLADNRRDFPRAITSILADRACGMLALMCIGSAALFIGPPIQVPDWMAWIITGGTVGLLAGLALPFVFPAPFRRFKWPFVYFENPASLSAALGLSLVIQLSIVAVNILIGFSLDAEIPLLYYFVFIPMVTIASMVPISLNGLGVREGAYVYFLTQAGMSDSEALVFSLVWLILILIVSGVGGGVWIVTSRREKSRGT